MLLCVSVTEGEREETVVCVFDRGRKRQVSPDMTLFLSFRGKKKTDGYPILKKQKEDKQKGSHTHTHTHTHTRTLTRTRTHTRTHTRARTHLHTNTHTHTLVRHVHSLPIELMAIRYCLHFVNIYTYIRIYI